MKILMVSPFDLVVERLWGPTLRLHSLAKEMVSRGHTVILAGPPPFYGEMPSTLNDVEMHYFKRPFHRYSYRDDGRQAERKKINKLWKLPLVMMSRWAEISKLIKVHCIDILYVNRANVDTAYPAFMAHISKRVPIICDWDDLEGIHGFSTMFRQPLAVQLFETINETCFPRIADATVVASRYLREFAIKIGVRPETVHYAPTVADCEAFHPALDGSLVRGRFGLDGKKILLYVGSLEEGNGVRLDSMLHTMKLLVDSNPSFVLLIVGEGDLLRKEGKKGKLVQLSESLGLSDKVVFTGGIPYADVPSYVAAADLCLALFPVNMVTLTKSPLKVYEYMASGKPVLGRNIGELSHCIKHGETGLLVYSDDPVEYAGAILDCFSKSGYLEFLGKNARKRIEDKFSWKNSADVVLEACNKLLHGH